MLYIERREKILEMLRKSGNVKVSDLVDNISCRCRQP